jgi:hypothetical protein
MIEAVLVVAGGLFGTAIITHRYGYRLGGTVTLPVLALYTLKTFWMLPLFVMSGLVGYLALHIAREHTLIYGRQELHVALIAGSVPPIIFLLFLPQVYPVAEETITQLSFLGGIVPGLAAYNFHQIRPEYRWTELAVGAGFTALLIVGGALLISPQTTILTEFTPSILFSQTSDIAHFRNAVVQREIPQEIAARPLIILLLSIGMAITETIRARLGLSMGIITIGLIALFTVSSRRLLFLFLLITPICFAIITICNRRFMLYGRVLIGIGTAIGVLLTPIFLQLLGGTRGLSALFVGMIAGIDAYNLHTTAPVERRQSIPLAIGVYAILLLLTRAFVSPFRRGFPQELGIIQVGGLLLLAALGIGIAMRVHTPLPGDEAVFSASVLSGGDE